MADGFRSKGAAITGVALESETPNVDGELIIVADVKTRKRLLLERAEVIIALAGGLGTLDELTEIIELKKEGLHCKPIIILNTAGFYDGLLAQLQRMDAEGFLPVVEKEGIKVQTLDQLVRIVQTPEEVVAFVGELEKADSTHD